LTNKTQAPQPVAHRPVAGFFIGFILKQNPAGKYECAPYGIARFRQPDAKKQRHGAGADPIQ
jgi:hypothetical protein